MGTLIAWVLVRDNFPGKRVLDFVIDIPFALPTIVAGLVLLAVYGKNSPVGVNLLGTRRAIVIALLFVTLPFVVRSVQPVLQALDTESELAARLSRRRAVDDVPAHHLAVAGARHRIWRRAGLCPRDGRVRLDAAHLRRAQPDHSGVRAHLPEVSRTSTSPARRRSPPSCCW